MDKYELTQNEILAGGYRIYTELDPKTTGRRRRCE